MSSHRLLVPLIFCTVLLLPASTLSAADEIDLSAFIQVRYSEKTPTKAIALDTAVVRFEPVSTDGDSPKNCVTVDLIGAVHIADVSYYVELNKLFREYDVVLFELVAEEGTQLDPKVVAASGENPGLIGGLQNGFASVLKLEHQLHHIDYTLKNMVHADMDPERFLQRMIDEGELIEILIRAMIQSLNQADDQSDKTAGRMFGSLLASRDKSIALKRAFAAEMCKQTEDELWVFEGDEGSTLIRERNDCALKKLQETIDRGEKKIAIFYGAAHLYDFCEQLEKRFEMKPTGITWVKAWDMGENAERSYQ